MSKKFLFIGIWTLAAFSFLALGVVKANDLRNESKDVSVSSTSCSINVNYGPQCGGGCSNGYKKYYSCSDSNSEARSNCKRDRAANNQEQSPYCDVRYPVAPTLKGSCRLDSTCNSNGSSTTGSSSGSNNNGSSNTVNQPASAPKPTCSPAKPGKVYIRAEQVSPVELKNSAVATIAWLENDGWGNTCGAKVKRTYTVKAMQVDSNLKKCSTKKATYTRVGVYANTATTRSNFSGKTKKISLERNNDSTFKFEAGKSYCMFVSRTNGKAGYNSNIVKINL